MVKSDAFLGFGGACPATWTYLEVGCADVIRNERFQRLIDLFGFLHFLSVLLVLRRDLLNLRIRLRNHSAVGLNFLFILAHDLSVYRIWIAFTWLEAHRVVRCLVGLQVALLPTRGETSPRRRLRCLCVADLATDQLTRSVSVGAFFANDEIICFHLALQSLNLLPTHFTLVGLRTIHTVVQLLLKASRVRKIGLLVLQLVDVALFLRGEVTAFGTELRNVRRCVNIRRMTKREVCLRQSQLLSLDKLGVAGRGNPVETAMHSVGVRLIQFSMGLITRISSHDRTR